jgi:hypothetical protein
MSYQGWKNYETWCVNLWLSNDEASYHHVNELAHKAAARAEDREAATCEMAGWLKALIEDSAPDVDGMYGDLLTAAISEVDWYEVAASWLEDCDFPESEFEQEGE